MFETDCVKAEELPYLSLLRYVLGYVDTTKHSFSELSNELNIHTGSTYASVMHFHPVDDPKASSMHFVIHTKVLYEEMCPAMELITEMICDSMIEDDKRLYEIMARLKSRLQMDMSSNGHSTAYARAASYFSESACISEALSGIEFYRVVDRLESHFEEEKDALKEKLKELVRRIFCVEKLTVSLTSDEEGYELVTAQMPVLTESIRVDAAPAAELKFDLKVKNEGFKDASKVQYVARAGNFTKQAGLPYTGTLKILRTILSYDYMWLQIRVKGGAYGCMSGFDRSGDSYFVSYRDPNLDRTMEVYEQVPDYVRNFAADEREMTKYIIGTISALDTPLNPAAAGARSLTAWMSKITFDQIQKERDEILSADEEAIRALVPYMEAILSAQCLCVIGNEEKINENKEMFLDIEKLL
jgi:Zn-dependent M16 (insulinase) family peptidase